MTSIAHLHANDFSKLALSKGYSCREVEDYFEATRFVLRKHPEDLHSTEIHSLLNPTFSTNFWGAGYLIHEVDAFIEDTVTPFLNSRIAELQEQEKLTSSVIPQP
jgi:hypothetical protein